MTYHLKPSRERVEEGVRRVAAEEFSKITQVLASPDLPSHRQVHEVRKCTKRLRSLLRLIEPVCAEAGDDQKKLRDAARALSGARDSSAILERFSRLKLQPDTASDISNALQQILAHPDGGESPSRLLKTFSRDVRAIAKRVPNWRLAAEGFEAVRPGFKRGYKKLCSDFGSAIDSGNENQTHDWRKSTKIHWHQTMLLSRICPDAMDAHARLAGRLSETLGDWRDSGLLISALNELSADHTNQEGVKAARRAALRDQKRLLRKAERISVLVTAETPKALIQRCAAYWQATAG